VSRRDAVLGLSGLGLFEASGIIARRRLVDPFEERVFRVANDAADGLRVPVRAVMQAGTFATVPVASIVVALTGRRRRAALMAAAGTGAWLLAKAAKPLAGRARPALVISGVRTRETIAGDLGWVSGHTAVSTALALTMAPAVPAWADALLVGAVATTAFGRMFVGAHLPLDLIGGAGLGMMVASAVRVVDDSVARRALATEG
jgi:undecaprenyl-diphosphatase